MMMNEMLVEPEPLWAEKFCEYLETECKLDKMTAICAVGKLHSLMRKYKEPINEEKAERLAEEMENQVLSVKQMQELISMGIDVSNASMCWVIDEKGEHHLTFNKPIIDKEFVPTFTLQDILETLPNIEGYYYPDLRRVTKMAWQVMYKPQLGELPWLDGFGKTSLDAAFRMLKMCKENNYI